VPLKVGLTYNLRKPQQIGESTPEDFYIEFDTEDTVNAIGNALNKAGCKVIKIEADEKAYYKLKRTKPDIVFNIAEGLRGESRESHIPIMLEILGIPYVGSGPLSLAISLNKALTHQLLRFNGVSSPSFQLFNHADEPIDVDLTFPFVVKPISEGSSKGIRNSSLVKDEPSLRQQVSWVNKNYDQAAIVEEFLPGREFTVGLIGNDDLMVLPIVEILIAKLPSGVSPLYSYEAKWIWDVPEKPLDIFTCPADVDENLENEIRHIAVKTFRLLNCRDFCRIDLRLDTNNKPHVLEVNPIPGLLPNPKAHSCLPEAARAAGFTYDQLICTILWKALHRYNMQYLLASPSLIKSSP